MPTNCNSFLHNIFDFETVRLVKIRDLRVGMFYRFLQSFIVVYILGYQIIVLKGYQQSSQGISSVTTKIKGSFAEKVVNGSELIFDPQDYVLPQCRITDIQEPNAFFILTRTIETRNQTRGTCAEHPSQGGATCISNSDCFDDSSSYVGHGTFTGRCRRYSQRSETKTCEIRAWCPVEDDQTPIVSSLHRSSETNESVYSPSTSWHFKRVVDATVFVKNFIYFEEYGIKRRNLVEAVNKTTLKKCKYSDSSITNRYCPIFRLGDLLTLAGVQPHELDHVMTNGAVFSLNILWDCDFDLPVRYCLPTYEIHQVDKEDAEISPGWNFRDAQYYYDRDTERRRLLKAYGLLFEVNVRAVGRKFDVSQLVWKIGAGVAFFGLSTFICDFILLNCMPGRKDYKQQTNQVSRTATLSKT